MCIAILNKSNLIDFDSIKNSFENNKDGASFTYIESNQLKVWKELSFNNVTDFYQRYERMRKQTDKPIMLHFRIGTSGNSDLKNLHPFFVNQNLALSHNGIIDIPELNKNFNDTWHFTMMLRKFKKHEAFLNKNTIEFQSIESFINSNKIIFLHSTGKFSIMNEDLGHWKDNNWYSNKTYETCNYYNVGGKKVYKYYDDWFDDFPQTNIISPKDFRSLPYIERCKLICEMFGFTEYDDVTFDYSSEAYLIQIDLGFTNLNDTYEYLNLFQNEEKN